MPDLYADDLVVQVTDGHNLIGNPNFEANGTDGWSAFGNAVVGLSQTVHNTGTSSLVATSRTASTAGPRYVLPIGAARYNVSFHVLHNGTSAHDLALAATYTCLGGTQTSPPPAATVAATPHNTWTTLSGTVTLPPANAPAGCRLVQADVHVQQEPGTCAAVECPDIYVDDASITLAP
jgi:hypothetical protein